MRRRRFLSILGTGAALAVAGSSISSARARSWQWRGIALGADATIRIRHEDEDRARHILEAAASEIHRLEKIFSLYRQDSVLSRLNRTGEFVAPPAELVDLLSVAETVSLASDGAFDVSVQPLWNLYARHFDKVGPKGFGPSDEAISDTRQIVDYRAIEVDGQRLVLGRPDMALTLNGIAQGYIADRVTARLASLGVTDTLIDTGEFRALGHRHDGRSWRLGIDKHDPILPVSGQAVATSGAAATRFDAKGHFHHLFDPRTGRPATTGIAQISVVASSAALADAASTALAVLPANQHAGLKDALGLRRVLRLNSEGTLDEV
ncbi:MAG: FAD:protein FMN transferase [Geminicoccaceae bacterium]